MKNQIRTISSLLTMNLLILMLGCRTVGTHRAAPTGTTDLSMDKAVSETYLVPKIVSTHPVIGAPDVDPALTEISVTFDQDMGDGMSWTSYGEYFPPSPVGQNAVWRDKRTCVMPVILEPGKSYRLGINSKSYQNFTGVLGIPVTPCDFYFTTK